MPTPALPTTFSRPLDASNTARVTCVATCKFAALNVKRKHQVSAVQGCMALVQGTPRA